MTDARNRIAKAAAAAAAALSFALAAGSAPGGADEPRPSATPDDWPTISIARDTPGRYRSESPAVSSGAPASPGQIESCVDDAYEDDDTAETARPVPQLSPEGHVACDPDFFKFGVPSGGGTVFIDIGNYPPELAPWITVGTSDSFRAGPAGQRMFYNHGGGIWGSPIPLEIQSSDRSVSTPYRILKHSLSECGYPDAARVTIPVARHVELPDGSLVTTDVRIHDPGSLRAGGEGLGRIDLSFIPRSGSPGTIRKSLPVIPGETLELRDIVHSLFRVEGAGAIDIVLPSTSGGDDWLNSDGPFVTAMETISIPGRPSSSTTVRTETRYRCDDCFHASLEQPFGDFDPSLARGARLTIAEIHGAAATVAIRVADAAGGIVGERAIEIASRESVEIIDPIGPLGVVPFPGERLSIRTVWGCGEVAGLIDLAGHQGEPVSLRASSPQSKEIRDALDTGSDQVFPLVASASGRYGSDWKTELTVTNLSPYSNYAVISFFPDAGLGPTSREYRMNPNQELRLDDVIRTLLPVGGRGSLVVHGYQLRAVCHVRDVASGRWGTIMNGITRSDATTKSIHPVSLLLPPWRPDTRTNLGLLLLDYAALGIRLRLRGLRGEELASREIAVSTATPFRVEDLFATADVDPSSVARIELETVDGNATLFACASVVDNLTNDSVYVPPNPIGGQVIPEIRLAGPGIVLRSIPAGEFDMGSPAIERSRDTDEQQHHVKITTGFFLSEMEINAGQWFAVMGSLPDGVSPEAPGLPIRNVSWNDVAGPGGFLERLNLLAAAAGDPLARTYRLPTEAEWELAARAGTSTRFWSGEIIECGDGCEPCTERESLMVWCGHSDARPARVDDPLPRNRFGLYHVSGNVWEWVADSYAPFDSESAIDPTGPATGDSKVLRGGSFRSEAKHCRSANRYGFSPDTRRDDLGFRLAADLPMRP